MCFGVKLRVKTIHAPHWYSNGVVMIARQSLPSEHPESLYNWILRAFQGEVKPEDFGIRKRPTGEEEARGR